MAQASLAFSKKKLLIIMGLIVLVLILLLLFLTFYFQGKMRKSGVSVPARPTELAPEVLKSLSPLPGAQPVQLSPEVLRALSPATKR